MKTKQHRFNVDSKVVCTIFQQDLISKLELYYPMMLVIVRLLNLPYIL